MGWLAGEAEGGYPEAPGVMGAGILALLPDSRGAPGGSHTCPHLSPHLHLLDLSHSVAPSPGLALSIEQTHPSLVPGAVPSARSCALVHKEHPRGPPACPTGPRAGLCFQWSRRSSGLRDPRHSIFFRWPREPNVLFVLTAPPL